MTSRIPGRPNHVVGEKHHKAKLTEDDVRMMRHLHFDHGVSTRELARKWEVTQRAAYQVVAFISWRHVL